ncbi:MAG: DUF3267 domain-containing protein [Planctomycetota bacterium]
MIPGFIIAWLTFPGIIVHETAHLFFCQLFGLAILDVSYFRPVMRGPSGYVIHEPTDRFGPTFFIACGPFLVNSLFCFLICFSIFLPIRFFGVDHWLFWPIGWLGLSIGMHAFPSNQDAYNLWGHAKKQMSSGNILAVLVFPIVFLVYIGNLLSMLWADLFYAVFIGLVLPELMTKWIFN